MNTAEQITMSPLLLLRLRRAGIRYPYWTVRMARKAGLGLPLACAFLMEETGGGQMIYGHDEDRKGRCPGWGWGAVTEENYAAFLRLRKLEGRSNGVGGLQLTSPGLQDEADRLGGCWKVRYNFAVGFHYVVGQIKGHPGNVRAGIASYNGSGPAAQAYADRILELAAHFKEIGCGHLIGIYPPAA